MSTTNTGGPAFPGFDYIDQYGKKNPEGMTLRDYFAAKAMQGICTTLATIKAPNWTAIAIDAYKLADTMLKAREQ